MIVALIVYALGAIIWGVFFGTLHSSSRERPDEYMEGTPRYAARGVLVAPIWPAVLLVKVTIEAGKWFGRVAVDSMKKEDS